VAVFKNRSFDFAQRLSVLSSVILVFVVGWLMEKTAQVRLGKRQERFPLSHNHGCGGWLWSYSLVR
jgi:hypothetical protein